MRRVDQAGIVAVGEDDAFAVTHQAAGCSQRTDGAHVEAAADCALFHITGYASLIIAHAEGGRYAVMAHKNVGNSAGVAAVGYGRLIPHIANDAAHIVERHYGALVGASADVDFIVVAANAANVCAGYRGRYAVNVSAVYAVQEIHVCAGRRVRGEARDAADIDVGFHNGDVGIRDARIALAAVVVTGYGA